MRTKVLPDDRLARLIGMPVLSLSIALLLKFRDPEFIKVLIISFLNCIVIWEGCRQLFMYFRHKFPLYHQTRQRLVYQSILILGYTLVVAVLMNFLCHTLWPGDPTPSGIPDDFIKVIVPTICVVLVYESVYFFEEWKKNVKQTESLARENVQSQLEVLKNQLDPHFLFNSLNTLASLIDYENTGAQQYLERLSDVYRLNRQFIAALASIAQIHTYFNNKLKLELQPKIAQEVLVSRERVQLFKEWICLH